IAAAPRAELVGVVSRAPERAAAFAAEHGGRAFERWEDAVAAEDVDAVAICTPNDTHPALGVAALQAGKHVLIEYPLARTEAEGRPLVEAARAAGRVLHAGHTMRYHGKQSVLREVAARLGPLRIADISVLFGRKPRKWYPDPKRLGSVFVGAMIHFHDELQQLFGPVAWVEGHLEESHTPEGLVDWDVAAMWIGFAGGGLGRITYGRGLQPPGWEFTERYAFAGGYARVEGERIVLEQDGMVERLSIPAVDTVAADTEAFLREVLDGAAPALPADVALRSVAVGEAAARAAADGRRVYLSD
ncbi:MAG TPA: Gfo/Idh/MocA family oxidoreductase, partial [Limnochordia bacterium]